MKDIYYVEVQRRKICYHTSKGDFQLQGTLRSAEDTLERYSFVKGSKWYILNLAHLEKVEGNRVWVHGTELPLSRNYVQDVQKAFNDYIGGNLR